MSRTPAYTLALVGSSSGHIRDRNFMGIIDLVIYDRFIPESFDRHYPLPSPTDTILLTNRYAFPSSFRIVINKLLCNLQPPYSGYECISGSYRPKRTRELFRTSNPHIYRTLLADLSERTGSLEATKAAFDELFKHNNNFQFTEVFARQIRQTVESLGTKLGLPNEEMRSLDLAISRSVTAGTPAEKWMSTVQLVMPLEKVVERHAEVCREEIQKELAVFQQEASEWLSSDDEKTDQDWKKMKREQEQWKLEEEEELGQDRQWDYLSCKDLGMGEERMMTVPLADIQTQYLPPWTANLLLLNGVAAVFRRYLNPADRNDAGRYPAISRLIMNELAKTRGRFEWVVGMRVPYTTSSKIPY